MNDTDQIHAFHTCLSEYSSLCKLTSNELYNLLYALVVINFSIKSTDTDLIWSYTINKNNH